MEWRCPADEGELVIASEAKQSSMSLNVLTHPSAFDMLGHYGDSGGIEEKENT